MNYQKRRRILIGDVHGHYDGLMQLLETIELGSEDELYFLGDLVDRGPNSAQVVEFVRQNNYPCVLGNHEQMFLDAFASDFARSPALPTWLYGGGHATLASYKTVPDIWLVQHLQWMQELPGYIDLGDVWLVHAGVDPNLPLEEQTNEQFCWIRDEFHAATEPYFAHKQIIFGHTITYTFAGVEPGKLVRGPGWLAIDTGVYSPVSGWLTAVDIDNNWVYQVNVLQPEIRQLPLSEAVVEIQPPEECLWERELA
ncbi:metallophosphoesterase family protein [Geitlerinema sp. PCC 9228]|jgi:serine/threonine protein phosphatase 1|uniref:metallophosphoesterase family protein n=1 Tax=Geitlerinema sp. PCC 9228 TaxID=111611 RepID=UPI0008F9D744|nr:metallophosphoesterase family protein [Geitlerinema sp. PCC 9228]